METLQEQVEQRPLVLDEIPAPATSRSRSSSTPYLLGLCAILAFGVFLRIPAPAFSIALGPVQQLKVLHPAPKFDAIGFDEGLYGEYVNGVIEGGLTAYPDIVDHYIEVQKQLTGSILPPVRFLYIFSGYVWHQLFGSEALTALRDVASFFSILTLFLSTAFAWRLRGKTWALGVAALMSVAPTQIHMSQHALVDGFFTFWALCCLSLLWENLMKPANWLLLTGYMLSLCCLVLTKENAFFVYLALLAIIASNRWLSFGVVSRELLLCTFAGPLLGVVVLVFLAGGFATLLTTYQLSVSKNYQLAYAILTGDGPWHRYLVDLLLVSPIVLILAAGAAFRLDRSQKPELFLFIFVATSYLVMCNIKYGMNLRYANMWDMPLRFLAVSQLVVFAGRIYRYRILIFSSAILLLCASELRQYIILFVRFPLYELVPEGLLRALHILKTPGR
jgi:hypothetical protein